jgi:(5-formylfuran-3-yl)methyl phosphate synthase
MSVHKQQREAGLLRMNADPAPPRLLVSVRSASEALAALAGGADVIDVKDPDRGPLGAPDAATIAAVVSAVDGRAPVTAAVGELVDMVDVIAAKSRVPIPDGVSLLKIGLSNCRDLADWQSRWREAVAALSFGTGPQTAGVVAVAYADWRDAKSPDPDDVLALAVDACCPVLLVDTWNKSGGTLLDHWPAEDLHKFVRRVQAAGLAAVLAGSLSGTSFAAAARLIPDFVAVRTAACELGRRGTVSGQRVALLRSIVVESRRSGGRATAKVFS